MGLGTHLMVMVKDNYHAVSREIGLNVYLFFLYVMCIMLSFSPCTLRFFVCTPGTAALWRRRPERPNRGRVSFTQTLLDKPCANGTVVGTSMGKRLSLPISIIPTDHPCDSVLCLFVCAGVDFRRKPERRNCGRVSCHSLPAVFPPLSIWANACLIVSTPSLVPSKTSTHCCFQTKTGNV